MNDLCIGVLFSLDFVESGICITVVNLKIILSEGLG